MIIAVNGGVAKGSGRSVEGFNLFEAITDSKEYLQKFGGHPLAAGITLDPKNISAFRDSINAYAKQHYPTMPAQKITVDLKLQPAALTTAIPDSISILEPFGAANPAPLFGLYKMRLESISPVGQGNHLRLNLSRGDVGISCMKFSMDEKSFPFVVGDYLDLAVSLENKMFRGAQSLTVHVKEIKVSGQDMSRLISSWRIYEKYKRDEQLSPNEINEIYPTRDDFAVIYKFIRASGWQAGLSSLLSRMPESMTLAKLRLCLDVLAERQLIAEAQYGEAMSITVLPTKGKTDLFESPLLKKIKK